MDNLTKSQANKSSKSSAAAANSKHEASAFSWNTFTKYDKIHHVDIEKRDDWATKTNRSHYLQEDAISTHSKL